MTLPSACPSAFCDQTRRGGACCGADPVRSGARAPWSTASTAWRRSSARAGWALVVSAVHLGLEQEVAIKFLLPEAMRNKVAVERFLREAKVAAKVRSEHVARVHDVGTLEEGGVPYIVMEHLEGLDLGQLIDKEGALPIDEACEIRAPGMRGADRGARRGDRAPRSSSPRTSS